MMRTSTIRQLSIGAEYQSGSGGTHFRVWAPQRKTAAIVLKGKEDHPIDLAPEGNGFFSTLVDGIATGAQYKFVLDGSGAFPDPASRFQPEGPHGFSQVVDPSTYAWTDAAWKGIRMKGQVVYELHLGTFTPAGTWASAAEHLTYLKETGITVIEVMPVADFSGAYGWGYDGVQPYAPAKVCGTPDDMRAFVNKAHAAGLSVILDVVYNHLGPDGNYLGEFSPFYFTDRHKTDWGAAINFDGEHSEPVRDFFIENAAYWIREFHLDGLRLDATQDIHDESEPHVLAEICKAAREAAGPRSIILIGENEPQNTRLIRPIEQGGYGLDALWNDDLHHSAIVALTGKNDAYYRDYLGTAQELLSAVKYGYLFQGQWYRWQKKRRGTPALGLPRESMITFIQNHDQVANSARGQRIQYLTSPGNLKAITALILLGPGTPMLFQGQEFGASSPFLFFADHEPELAEMVRKGRIEFLGQWGGLRMKEMHHCFADPESKGTFERCRLDLSEVKKHTEAYNLHKDLLRLRREDPVISRQAEDGLDGAVLSRTCLVLRFFSPGYHDDRLLFVNLGVDLEFNPSPEPLLGPPEQCEWTKLWSSEDPEYGGCGTPPLDTENNWRIPGQAAVVLQPRRQPRARRG